MTKNLMDVIKESLAREKFVHDHRVYTIERISLRYNPDNEGYLMVRKRFFQDNKVSSDNLEEVLKDCVATEGEIAEAKEFKRNYKPKKVSEQSAREMFYYVFGMFEYRRVIEDDCVEEVDSSFDGAITAAINILVEEGKLRRVEGGYEQTSKWRPKTIY